ncbi:hypothetical protein GCM10010168_42690 [Actinoplanes ianthinogenes]|uniref:Ig-like domain-containing protein n=1 Tax=Actinoplanes ianthinogenes TaxID=122358 RepID=A0ABM7LW45_9ACTN|nr:Ig-like domain-containing protein [Actinoplanes ianthinogenes]BCJ43421.1 hypothetical protein Aiant_40780 [Actinoplanes ianthinogenes]GGR20227.1 hypothetical protein GCM10010168_42690 [Actinoplanes ianthinogenes]
MRHRTVALSTLTTLAAGLVFASPAQAADGPVTDLGIAPGARVNRTVELRPTVAAEADVAQLQLWANNAPVAYDYAAPWSLSWNTRGIIDQDVPVYLVAVDKDGNKTPTGKVTVRVDNYAPLASFPQGWGSSQQYPASNNSFTGIQRFSLTPAGDADTVRWIQLSVGGQVIDTATAAPWPVTWDTSAFPEGVVKLTATTTDDLGNTTQNSAWLWVDRTGPATTVRFPQVAGYVSVHQPLAVEASDPATVDRAELYLNGVLADTATLNGAGVADLDLAAGTANGPATLTVKTYDHLGNVTEQTRSVVVDNDKPVAAGAPGSSYLRGTFGAGVSNFRDATGAAYLAVYFDDFRGTGFTERSPWYVHVNSRAVADGRHTLAWDVKDKAGNLTQLRRSVYVDNTAPAVRFGTAPKNRAKLTRKVTVKAIAADRFGIARVQLLVNGKVVATDSKAAFSFTLNPKKFGKKFTVQLRAYDRAGNVKYSTKRTYRR